MIKLQILAAPVLAAAILLGAAQANAHCDAVDGPVAKAVLKALETGNLYPVLAYAPASAEGEIRAAFDKSRKVRNLGPDARELADHAVLETVVRLHRAGEGAVYTGLQPAGLDYGPVIEAAEAAVETGDAAALEAMLMEEIKHSLEERLARVRLLQKAPLEPKTPAEVPHSRERISAELGFITFAESLRQAAIGKGEHLHAD